MLSDMINLASVVRQGAVFSPILFAVYVNDIIVQFSHSISFVHDFVSTLSELVDSGISLTLFTIWLHRQACCLD